jgi:hypothetical protein
MAKEALDLPQGTLDLKLGRKKTPGASSRLPPGQALETAKG